jgi:hypothetical protein
VADATRPNISLHPDPCHGQTFTAPAFETFAQKTWKKSRWERQRPKALTIAAAHHRFACAAGAGNRKAMKRSWALYRRIFYKHRRGELWRSRVTPFEGGGQHWAIPYAIVVCESGVRGYVPSGYYGILFSGSVPTWQSFSDPGFAPSPGQASKREQDIVAHRLYVAYGLQPWECAGIVGLS